jgi:hypothetical protein
MSTTWRDPRDLKTWKISVEGRAGEIASGAQVQLLGFRGDAEFWIVYDGSKEVEELADEDLCALLDSARQQ